MKLSQMIHKLQVKSSEKEMTFVSMTIKTRAIHREINDIKVT